MWCPSKEVICEQSDFTVVNESLEQIFDEPSGTKVKVLKEV